MTTAGPTSPALLGSAWRGPATLGVLGVAVAAVSVIGASRGAFAIPGQEVVAILLAPLGLDLVEGIDPVAADVLWQIRFPRVALALVVGASLGCAGALCQGVFTNPLAEPSIIGVSAGSAVGAAGAIFFGWAAIGPWSVPLAAFAGGLVVTMAVYGAARSGGRVETVTLVLTGIAVNALAGALIGLLTYLSDDAALRSITFWNLGSLATATWSRVAASGAFVLVGLAAVPFVVRRLDLLALGEAAARHLGVDVDRTRLGVVVLVAALTGAGVAVAGIIGFVGLVVPHVVRLLVGPRHRILVPASALGGAVVVVVADLVARTAAAPAELPLGVLTALAGAPFFLWLLRRARRAHGGWA